MKRPAIDMDAYAERVVEELARLGPGPTREQLEEAARRVDAEFGIEKTNELTYELDGGNTGK